MISKEEIENKEDLLKKISKEQYGDEWFIEKAILSYKAQKEKTYTFYRNDKQENLLRKYNWCQRPCSSNMSLDRFVINGEIEGWMSESLAEHHGLTQVDLNEFIHKFVKAIIKENLSLKKENKQLETKQQKVIDKLEHDNEIDNIAVKKLEEKRRTATSDYYKNSYQTQIHKLNAKIETRKEILNIMKGEEI